MAAAAGVLASVVGIAVVVYLAGGARPEPTVPVVGQGARDLVNELVEQASGAGHLPPSTASRSALGRAVTLLAARQVRSAESAAADAGYELVRLTSPGGTWLARPAEPSATGGAWWFHRPDGVPVTVEVPHPVDDRETAELGLALFDSVGASDLVIAGSRRDASDGADPSAHPGTTFDVVHESLLSRSRAVVQVHGFASDKHPSLEADIVVSAGSASASSLHDGLVAALRSAGFAACLYPQPGCDELGGERNVQGRSAETAGVPFVHLEFAAAVRRGETHRAVADALAERLRAVGG